MKPWIFHSDLSGRYYYSARYKDLGDGKYECSRKIDVTDAVKSILEAYRVELLKTHMIVKKT